MITPNILKNFFVKNNKYFKIFYLKKQIVKYYYLYPIPSLALLNNSVFSVDDTFKISPKETNIKRNLNKISKINNK